MRIFFVGIHNKKGMKPLDSKTMTGKVINKIIVGLKGYEVVKTNMCEVEYFPKDKNVINEEINLWYDKYEPDFGDIVVMLGAWVRENFVGKFGLTYISLTHPSGIDGTKNKDEYIEKAIKMIQKKIK